MAEKCWECEGSGIDAGSLNEPEPCPICYGTGIAPEEDDERFVERVYVPSLYNLKKDDTLEPGRAA